MRKVSKILLYLISGAILSAVVLPLAAGLLLSVPAVQRFVLGKVSRAVSARLGTTVSLDGVRLGRGGAVSLDRFYVGDFAGDTLLYFDRLSTRIHSLGLTGGGLNFGDARVEGLRFYLDQHEGSDSLNLQQVIARIRGDRPKKEKKPFRLIISRIDIDGAEFGYRRWPERNPAYGVDFADMRLHDLHIAGRRLSIDGDTVRIVLDSVSFRERSGLRVEALRTEQLTVAGGLRFEDLRIATPDSYLRLPFLDLTAAEGWPGFKDFLHKVELDGRVTSSRLDARTLAYFVPSLHGKRLHGDGLNIRVKGPVADLNVRIERSDFSGVGLRGTFALAGLPDVRRTEVDARIDALEGGAGAIDELLGQLLKNPLPAQAALLLDRTGEVALSGRFKGRMERFETEVQLITAQGGVEAHGKMEPGRIDGTRRFSAGVSTVGFDLGGLLGNDKLGRVLLRVDASGLLGEKGPALTVAGNIPLVQFGGYDYSGLSVNGRLARRRFVGGVASSDPNLHFDLDGTFDFADPVPRYDFFLRLFRGDLHALGINRRDSVAVLTADVEARGSGITLDDFNGSARIDRAVYRSVADTLRTGGIVFTGENSTAGKHLALTSPFADVEFRSRIGYRELFDYLASNAADYLPSFSDSAKREPSRRMEGVADVMGYSLLKIDLKEADALAGIVSPGLRIAPDTRFSAVFNPEAKKIVVSGKSDYIENDRFFVTGIALSGRNAGDSLTLSLQTEDLYAAGLLMPGFSVQAGIREGGVGLELHYADTAKGTSASLGIVSKLSRDSLTGAQQVSVSFTPSTYSTPKQTWRIASRGILYDASRVEIDRFRIFNGQQELVVDGTLSRHSDDTLHVGLNDFELSPLSSLTERAGYRLDGYTSGHLDLVSALRQGRLVARLDFDSVTVNGIAVPPARFASDWDFGNQRARFTIEDRNRRDTVLRGYYSPGDGRYLADLALDNVTLALLDPVLEGVMRDNRGSADLHLRVNGRGNSPQVAGRIRVDSLFTTVDFTGVTYRLDSARIDVKNTVFTLDRATLYDVENNRADLSMTLDMSRLANIKYRVDVRPHDLIALDMRQTEDEPFYGKVYASGSVGIAGDKMGVKMNIVATTGSNSVFSMPLSGKSSIAEADFVVFRDVGIKRDTVENTRREMLRRAARRGRRTRTTQSALSINMALNVKPNTEIQLVVDPTGGNVLKARGNGQLNLRIDPSTGEFTMNGDYSLTEGSYQFNFQNLISKTFTVEPGSSIQWMGQPLDALLNITAVYRLKTSVAPLIGELGTNLRRNIPVECLLMIRGSLASPEITFDVRVPNADTEVQAALANALNTSEARAKQFFSLLATNSFMAENGIESMGATSGSALPLEFLTSQLSNILSVKGYSVNLNYRPKSELTSDEVDFGISKGLIDDRLLIEVEGNYDTGNNPAQASERGTSNLSGDFAVTYLFDESGNLRAKIFSRTIDRFDENQGLQESGIGIYYREDFNSFRDIVRNFRERFSGKNREKRREARRQRRADRRADREARDARILEAAAQGSSQAARDDREAVEETERVENETTNQ